MLLSLCYVAAEAVRQSEELSGLPGLPMAVWLGTASICWCRITHQPSARTTRRPSPVAGQAGLASVQLPLPSSLALPASKQHDRNHPTKNLKAARLFFSPSAATLEQCPATMENLPCPAALLAARHAPELDRPDTGATAIYDRRLVALRSEPRSIDRSISIDAPARLGQAPVTGPVRRSARAVNCPIHRLVRAVGVLAASGEPSRALQGTARLPRPRSREATARGGAADRAGRAHQVVTGGRGTALACLISRPGRLGLARCCRNNSLVQ
jgi:hypothetical protein